MLLIVDIVVDLIGLGVVVFIFIEVLFVNEKDFVKSMVNTIKESAQIIVFHILPF